MALPLGKFTLIIGAGLAGSILVNQGCTSHVSRFLSSSCKIWTKLWRDDSNQSNHSTHKPQSNYLEFALDKSTPKPENDSLEQQVNSLMGVVNSLREELQLLASNGSLTSAPTTTSGFAKYGVIIGGVVAGYGYIWWKGWRLGLNEKCASLDRELDKQLDNVYSTISATSWDLWTKIDSLGRKIDKSMDKDNSAATGGEDAASLSGTLTIQLPCCSAFDDFDKPLHPTLEFLRSDFNSLTSNVITPHGRVLEPDQFRLSYFQ